jgi:hypothetical protein
MEVNNTNEGKTLKENKQHRVESKNLSLKKIIKKMPFKLSPNKTECKNFVGGKNIFLPEFSQKEFFIQKQKSKNSNKYYINEKKFMKNYLSAKKTEKLPFKNLNKNSHQNLEKYIASANNKHFILPKFKKKKPEKNLKNFKNDKKYNYSHISAKEIWKEKQKNDKNKSMVFFILSKNLDQLLLKKLEKKNNSALQIDIPVPELKKEDLKKKKKCINIKTPHGNFTLENAFSKPQIVINNFMINNKEKDENKFESKRKNIQSSQNSPKTKNYKFLQKKNSRSHTKKSLKKYFENLRFNQREKLELKMKELNNNKSQKRNLNYKSCHKKNLSINLIKKTLQKST